MDEPRVLRATAVGAPLAQRLRRGPAQARVVARFAGTLVLESGAALWALTTRPNPGAYRVVLPRLPEWDSGDTLCAGDGVMAAGRAAGRLTRPNSRQDHRPAPWLLRENHNAQIVR